MILRVQPNVKKLYLLIRSTPKRSIEQRLQEEVVDMGGSIACGPGSREPVII
ncbi:hypothetical protein CASFOL_035093 [Castilleja foliolosa]|uniref:Thioester reductase (TE) domain-containing protein n=1 Tax=Castilleja foliolosa TaxID=1961234 RepID=A0ABD3BRP7_9LAMI